VTKSVVAKRNSWAALAVTVLAAASLAVSGPVSTATATAGATAATGPCGTLTGTPLYQHVVILMDENVRYSTLAASAQAPYLHSLSAQCGVEKFMHAATHPSQPNYMALASGQATAVGAHVDGDNIFHQATVAGLTWKAYEESMPAACGKNGGIFLAGHNPPFWFNDLKTPKNLCKAQDLPMSPSLDTDIQQDTLPALSWITPNGCNDMHGLPACPQPTSQRIAVGDTWLSTMIPRLTALPSYQAGKTLIVVTWDEGDGKAVNGSDCSSPAVYQSQPSCQIPTIIVSPYVAVGATDSADHNLYGLLGDVEDILGLPRLGRAVGQPSLRPGLQF
jgi:phosphatidylinositol-3-phosphatase